MIKLYGTQQATHSKGTVGPNQITWPSVLVSETCMVVDDSNGWTSSDLRKVKPGVLLNTKFLRIKKNSTFMLSPPDWLLFDTVTLEDAES